MSVYAIFIMTEHAPEILLHNFSHVQQYGQYHGRYGQYGEHEIMNYA